LLASLDAQPDGWRRCALAFLEAQIWRSEMRRIIAPAAAAPADTSTSAVETEAPQSSRRYGGAWLAV
jgi:hypothetical protein